MVVDVDVDVDVDALGDALRATRTNEPAGFAVSEGELEAEARRPPRGGRARGSARACGVPVENGSVLGAMSAPGAGEWVEHLVAMRKKRGR